jgi:hypothetical protein
MPKLYNGTVTITHTFEVENLEAEDRDDFIDIVALEIEQVAANYSYEDQIDCGGASNVWESDICCDILNIELTEDEDEEEEDENE